ncbi:MAG: hypothetical protein N2Z79_00705, partial [Candidatus Omnitrophica bacterium]|nr:hypothetical protein [Candidatus Omnitrophota bacterium]
MTLLNLLNRRERILFYITLVIILSFLIFHFLVVPLFSKFVKLNKEIIATKIKLEKSLRLIAEKDSILSVSDKISTSGDEKKELFLSRILSKLEEFSAEAGLKIIEIRPQISK